ncbi:MAG TPA: hypothetical protein VF911_07340 [Thermoanaerobaculia bacterium]|jgi:hypothetical protein
MRLKKTWTEVTVETETVIAVSGSAGGAEVGFCPACSVDRVMLTPLAAARLTGTSAREIYRLVECGGLHSRDAPNGQLLVCAVSLQAGRTAPSTGNPQRGAEAPRDENEERRR